MFRHDFTALAARCSLLLQDVTLAQGRDAAERVEQRVADLAARYSFHARDSWLNRVVNDRQGPVVPLDDESARLLATVHAHAARTRGAYDITLGTYAGPMRRARTTYDAVAVRRRLAGFTGLERWQVDGHQLRFDNPTTRIDLGGVLLAHALDEAAALLRAAGVPAGVVNFGGDLVAFGARADAVIAEPLCASHAACGLALRDQALATATHDARKRSNRNRELALGSDGDAAQNRWLSASVVSPSALLSGLYSCALLAAGDVDLLPDMHAVAIDHDHAVHRWGCALAA